MKNFICDQYGEKHTILNAEYIKIYGWITKLEAIKTCSLCAFPFTSAENLNYFPDSVAMCLRWGG